jgi:Rrf2 family protein
MKISAKGRYALAAMIHIATDYDNAKHITVIRISEQLGISKIYLEQVFSLLKRGGLVISVKGARGGYQLSRIPEQITVLDILSAVELTLFETTEETVMKNAPDIEKAMRVVAFDVLDCTVKKTLSDITLANLVVSALKHKTNDGFMFYI